MSAEKQESQPQDDWYKRWTMSMPEDKLELIDGKLIISTLTGSRRILYYLGKVPQGPEQYGYGETLAACEDDLRQMVYNWLLLCIARREPLPASWAT